MVDSQLYLADYFPNLEKIPIFKKNFFFFEDWDFHSVNTHFNLMAKYLL